MATETKWATLETPFSVDISNSCTCIKCPACGMTSTGEPVECDCCDTAPMMVETKFCTDICWDIPYDDLKENIFPEFLERVGNPDYLRIDGTNMTWLRRSGHAIVRANWDAVWDKVTIRGDYRLTFILADNTFKIMRYSHDEPTGCGMVISAAANNEFWED